jgi:hypothetical protein
MTTSGRSWAISALTDSGVGGLSTLPAYMLGSAASFAAQTGDLHPAVLLLGKARHVPLEGLGGRSREG